MQIYGDFAVLHSSESVIYRTLQDVSFVVDTSNVLIAAAAEPTLFVRWRVAWSLGNLSDALVLNR